VKAQAGKLQIFVFQPNGQPAVGCMVSVSGAPKGPTDANGQILLRGVAPHGYTVTAAMGMMNGTGTPNPVVVKKGELSICTVNLTMPGQ
jgi:hypothetical protein